MFNIFLIFFIIICIINIFISFFCLVLSFLIQQNINRDRDIELEQLDFEDLNIGGGGDNSQAGEV